MWDELPSAYEFSNRMVERLTREWLELVERDRSHPSVITWVAFNESWGVWHGLDVEAQRSLTRALYHLTKSLDPGRPVISNDGWEHTESDIWGLHDYAPTGEPFRERYADRDGWTGSSATGHRPAGRRCSATPSTADSRSC